METNTTAPPASPAAENHNHDHHHSHSQPDTHHHGFLPFNPMLVIIIPTSILLVLAIIVIVVMLRRLKSAKNNGSSKSISSSSRNQNGNLIPHTAISFNTSPGNNNSTLKSHKSLDFNFNGGFFEFSLQISYSAFENMADVKGGCLYGGSLIRTPASRFKGVQVFTYKELEMATEKFSESNVIGDGGFGVAYRGVLSDGTVAAIKMLRRDGKQGERAFRIEVDLLTRLHSPYLVELLGYCADQHYRLLIFEYMPNGTLQSQLHPFHNQQRVLDWGTRLRIALDCARALEFLHEHAVPSVIHRDFKSSNVLLDQNLRAKVSDFGLAKTVSDKINGQILTRVLGTTGYVAPEYASSGKLTTKSDVYSYGVVLLELLTGRAPVDARRLPGEDVLVSWALPRLTNRQKLVEMVDPALQGHYSKKDLVQVAAIAAVCVQHEADYRPLMTDVVQSLIPLVKNYSSISSSGSSRFQMGSSRY